MLDGLVKEGFRVENYGDIMLKEAKRKKYVKDRDEMRKLPVEKQKEIQKLAARYLSTIKSVIIDTHFSIATECGYLPGLPAHILKELKPDLLISIEADPAKVFERRKKDAGRNRDNDTIDSIRMHTEINRNYAVSYSSSAGCPFMIVMNEEGKADEAAKNISSVIGSQGKGK